MYLYTCKNHTCMYTYVQTYVHREREPERERAVDPETIARLSSNMCWTISRAMVGSCGWCSNMRQCLWLNMQHQNISKQMECLPFVDHFPKITVFYFHIKFSLTQGLDQGIPPSSELRSILGAGSRWWPNPCASPKRLHQYTREFLDLRSETYSETTRKMASVWYC